MSYNYSLFEFGTWHITWEFDNSIKLHASSYFIYSNIDIVIENCVSKFSQKNIRLSQKDNESHI